MEFRAYDIPPDVWAAAWALHVTRDVHGYLHVNIEHFAASVGVPTDRDALAALAACVHAFAETVYRQRLPREDHVGPYTPKVTHH